MFVIASCIENVFYMDATEESEKEDVKWKTNRPVCLIEVKTLFPFDISYAQGFVLPSAYFFAEFGPE